MKFQLLRIIVKVLNEFCVLVGENFVIHSPSIDVVGKCPWDSDRLCSWQWEWEQFKWFVKNDLKRPFDSRFHYNYFHLNVNNARRNFHQSHKNSFRKKQEGNCNIVQQFSFPFQSNERNLIFIFLLLPCLSIVIVIEGNAEEKFSNEKNKVHVIHFNYLKCYLI